MKVFKFIGVMILLTSAFSACSGQSPMTVLCSIDWFMVTVHPFMLNNDVCVHFHELHLGLGCPPNHVQPHAYQFTYRVTECGIRVKAVSQDMVIYSTEIHYSSKGTPSKFVIPVSCAAPLKSPWLTKPCSMTVASQSRAIAQKDEKCYEVFSLSQSSQRPNCDCPPCVFNEEEHTQDPCHQAGAQEAQPLQPSHFLDISEDWSLHADDMIGSM
ncbi:placenta-specific protein 1 [Chlorocebus sabaeus]|uniref:Placenta-specific protein 1 n=3 Tax=Cercopithecinae TaxID=9528 RepID=A0A2K5L0Z4_CERAT|nr:placenta-specific protein 1 [Chlorocebus sabaeus]XP_011856713.1 PREDICTED: placenta-specific protein 1 [Mandrillus leucophaeus]XP_011856714.1 PREDICTED: placenta-specific protein 1 [Mandrillus leucophaeus]XP_011916402.1 PREDICTED: placenta-specific protein 1 [Cercocebus atys]XP_011916403.1 PREDICTED: placenta-specific protein 1 [Cercocebus atys]XP_011916404.1 PREDICTED: placenta-specific protein 1 [Cercocebus atys]XP_011916405.1 PREDICTED: placenta-specific protein 1 [Cercocebus atys]XP_0